MISLWKELHPSITTINSVKGYSDNGVASPHIQVTSALQKVMQWKFIVMKIVVPPFAHWKNTKIHFS